jgi:hypothetical protein
MDPAEILIGNGSTQLSIYFARRCGRTRHWSSDPPFSEYRKRARPCGSPYPHNFFLAADTAFSFQ